MYCRKWELKTFFQMNILLLPVLRSQVSKTWQCWECFDQYVSQVWQHSRSKWIVLGCDISRLCYLECNDIWIFPSQACKGSAECVSNFQDMLQAGDCPNKITFVGVCSLCLCSFGFVQEGFYYLNQLMKQIGIAPGLERHTCIVGLLSRAGQLDHAENYTRTMPVKWLFLGELCSTLVMYIRIMIWERK